MRSHCCLFCRDVFEAHGSSALVLNGSAFPCNSSAVLDGDGTPVAMSIDMNQAVLTEFCSLKKSQRGMP